MRRLIALGALVIFLVICVFSVWRSPDYQECKAEQAKYASTQKEEERHSQFVVSVDCFGSFISKDHDAVIAVFTIVLGIGTFLVWWATRDLVESAEQTARRQLRAYVFPANVTFADRGSIPGEPPNPALAGYIGAFMVIKNSGQTPAYEVIHWAELDVRRIDEEDTLRLPPLPFDRQGIATIAPGGENQ